MSQGMRQEIKGMRHESRYEVGGRRQDVEGMRHK